MYFSIIFLLDVPFTGIYSRITHQIERFNYWEKRRDFLNLLSLTLPYIRIYPRASDLAQFEKAFLTYALKKSIDFKNGGIRI